MRRRRADITAQNLSVPASSARNDLRFQHFPVCGLPRMERRDRVQSSNCRSNVHAALAVRKKTVDRLYHCF